MKDEAESADNLTILQRFDGRKDGTGDSMQDVVRARDADRAEREASLPRPVTDRRTWGLD